MCLMIAWLYPTELRILFVVTSSRWVGPSLEVLLIHPMVAWSNYMILSLQNGPMINALWHAIIFWKQPHSSIHWHPHNMGLIEKRDLTQIPSDGPKIIVEPNFLLLILQPFQSSHLHEKFHLIFRPFFF